MWNRNLEHKPTWRVADQKTKLPKCPNASPRQPLPLYTYGSRNRRHPATYRPLEKAVIGSYEWKEPAVCRASGYHGRHADASPVRPRIVTVVRPCGEHNLRKISLLLNRRAVQTFELLIADVSEALGFPRWNSDRVRHLFNPAGREIRSLSDFFYFGHAFLAFGNRRPSLIEVQTALEELYPDNSCHRDSMLRLWERILTPKAAKTDSGFKEDVPQVDSTQDVALNPLVTQLAANHLQSCYGQVKQKDRGRKERPREKWENREERGVMKHQIKEEKIEKEKQSVYCWSCRGTSKPIPPIGNMQHDKFKEAMNQSKAPLSQDKKIDKPSQQHPKTEVQDILNNVSATLQNEVLVPRTQKDTPEIVEQKDWQQKLPPDNVEVSPEQIQHCYELGSVVGDGNFAVVRECRVRGCTQTFAMKMVDKAKLQGRVHMIQNEIALLHTLVHPRLVQLLRSHHTDTHVYLLMELVPGGDLFDAIAQSGRFSEPRTAKMISDISQALEYIHNKSIAHRDIKPENLLVQHQDNGCINLKLADFGLALVVTEPVFTVCGTPTYVAPEILAETGYGVAVDVWAMGVILFVLLSGFPPFRSPERNQEELFRLILKGEVNFISPYWDNVSEGAKSLVRALLEVNPIVRLTASQTLQNSWLLHTATQNDQKEATDISDISDIIITKQAQLKSNSRTGYDMAKLETSAKTAQTSQTKDKQKSNTNTYKAQSPNCELIIDQRDPQTKLKPSQAREASKNCLSEIKIKSTDMTGRSHGPSWSEEAFTKS